MKKSDRRFAAKFLLPSTIMFVLVFLYPLLRTIAMSFFSVENVTGKISTWQLIGIGNYIKLYNTKVFRQVFTNLMKIWFFGGIAVMFISILFAAILNSGIKGKKFFKNLIYMPYTISTVALALMWIEYAYNPSFGLFTKLFQFLSLEKLAAIEWTGPDYKFLAMLIPYCFSSVGYHMVIFSAGIETIPGDYYDAARVDGCNKIKEFTRITWPLLRGSLKTNLIMWSIQCAGFYTWSMMFTADGKVDNITGSPVSYLYLKLFGGSYAVIDRDAGTAAAVGVLTGIFILLCFTLINFTVKDDDLEL